MMITNPVSKSETKDGLSKAMNKFAKDWNQRIFGEISRHQDWGVGGDKVLV